MTVPSNVNCPVQRQVWPKSVASSVNIDLQYKHSQYRSYTHTITQGMSTPLHNKLPGGSVKPTHNKEWLTGTPMEAQHKGTITATPAMTTTEDL